MNIERIEDRLSDLENDIEKHNEAAEKVETRKESISDAIKQLGEDASLVELLYKNVHSVEREESEVLEQREDALEALSSLNLQLELEMKAIESDHMVLEDLASMGEDVSEPFMMLDEKREWVMSCLEKMRELGDRLDAVLDSSDLGDLQRPSHKESDIASSCESQLAIVAEQKLNEATSHNLSLMPEDDSTDGNTLSGVATTEASQAGVKAHSASSPQGPNGDSPHASLAKYMNSHNYGADDYDIYSKDPEWNRLHKAVFPEYHQIAENEYLHNEKVNWIKQVVPDLNVKDTERTVRALEWYSTNGYSLIHWDRDGSMQETQDILRVIDSTNIHTFKGWIYRGLSFNSKEHLVKALEEYGGYWREPGITSFTTDIKMAVGFASNEEWGLVLKCTNNKTAIPVKHLSRISWENEILSPGCLRNRGWIIDQATVKIDEDQHLVFADMKETLSG